MRTTESKNQNQLPSQVVAEQSQLKLAISNFFKCYTLEDTENRIFRMLEEWIYDNGFKQSVSEAEDAGNFIKTLKSLIDLSIKVDQNQSSILNAEIKQLDEGFGIIETLEFLDDLLQCWFFSKNNEPELIHVCNKVSHCHDLVKLTRVLAKEGGLSC